MTAYANPAGWPPPLPLMRVEAWVFDEDKHRRRMEQGYPPSAKPDTPCPHTADDCIHTQRHLEVLRLSATFYFEMLTIKGERVYGSSFTYNQCGTYSRKVGVTRVVDDGVITYLITGADAGLFIEKVEANDDKHYEIRCTLCLEVSWDDLPAEVQHLFSPDPPAAMI